MPRIHIQRLRDVHSCETCGTSVSEGADIYFDGALTLSLRPSAHCFNDITYEDRDIYAAILEKLGHSLVYSTEGAAYEAALIRLGHPVTFEDAPRTTSTP